MNKLSNALLHGTSEERKIIAVWQKGHILPNRDPAFWRQDDYGFIIYFPDYGNRNSTYGWEKDHYPIPKSLGGSDDVSNLRPLHYRKNASLGGRLGNL